MSEFDELKRRIRITKNARFAAAKRLRKTGLWGLWTVTLLSLLLVFVSIFSIVFSDTMNSFQIKVIGVSSVMLSVYLICITLFTALADPTRRQAILYLSANSLLELHNRINGEGQAAQVKLVDYTHEYQAILDHYSENHDETDYLVAIALSEENRSIASKMVMVLQHNVRHVVSTLFLMVIPSAILIVTVYAFFGWGMFSHLSERT